MTHTGAELPRSQSTGLITLCPGTMTNSYNARNSLLRKLRNTFRSSLCIWQRYRGWRTSSIGWQTSSKYLTSDIFNVSNTIFRFSRFGGRTSESIGCVAEISSKLPVDDPSRLGANYR